MSCEDCGREYGSEHGFADLIIPYSAWTQISPTGDESGLLCPCCIIQRLHTKGIHCDAAIFSPVVNGVSCVEMSNLRRLENIELALEGRQNKLGTALTDRICQLAGVKQSDGWE